MSLRIHVIILAPNEQRFIENQQYKFMAAALTWAVKDRIDLV